MLNKSELKSAVATVETMEKVMELLKELKSSTLRKSVRLDFLSELNDKFDLGLGLQSYDFETNLGIITEIVEDRLRTENLKNERYAHLVQKLVSNEKSKNIVKMFDRALQEEADIECDNVASILLASDYIKAPVNVSAARKLAIHSMEWYFLQTFDILKEEGEPTFKVQADLEYKRSNAVLRTQYLDTVTGIGWQTAEYKVLDKKGNEIKKKITSPRLTEKLQNIMINILAPAWFNLSVLEHDKCYLLEEDGIITFMYYSDKDMSWVKLDKERMSEDELAALVRIGKARSYWYFPTSPSGKRKDAMALIHVPSDSLAEYKALVRLIINEANDGGWDIAREMWGDTEHPFSKMAKAEARLSLGTSDSSEFVGPKAIAWLNGKYGVINGVEAFDGAGFLSDKYISRSWGEKLGLNATSDEVVGFSIQNRFGFEKGMAVSVQQDLLIEMIKAQASDVIFVINDKEFTIFKKMYKDGKLVPNAVYVFNASRLEDVEFFGDTNCVKEAFDFMNIRALNALEIPGEWKNKCQTNNQMLLGHMATPLSQEAYVEIMKEHVLKIFALEEAQPLTRISQLGNRDYIGDSLFVINRQAALGESSLLANRLSQCLRKAENDINGLNFDIKGTIAKMFPDPVMMFGCSLLSYDEVFMAGIRGGKRCNLFRNPKTYSGEYVNAFTVSLKELRKRIFARFSKALARKIYRFFKNLKSGTIIVNSSNPAFAGYLGGADYDGDQVLVVFDERIVKLSDYVKMGSINYGKSSGENLMMKFDEMLPAKVYRELLISGNQKIGVIANMAMTFMAVSYHIRNNMMDDAGKVFNQEYWDDFQHKIWEGIEAMMNQSGSPKVINEYTNYDHKGRNFDIRYFFMRKNSDNNRSYESRKEKLLNSTLTLDIIEDWVGYVYTHEIFNIESFTDFLDDLVIILVAVCGHTIDAAKSGAKVHCPFKWLYRFFRGGAIAKISLNIKREKVNGKISQTWDLQPIRTGIHNVKYNGMVISRFTSNDLLCQIKNSSLEILREELIKWTAKIREAKNSDSGLRTNGAENRYALLVQNLNDLAVLRNGIADDINFKELKKYIVGFTRGMSRKLSLMDRFSVVKAASKSNRGSETRFWMDFSEEVVTAALEDHDGIVKESLYSFDRDNLVKRGKTLDFVKGRVGKYYLASKLSGKFTVDVDEKGIPVVYTTVSEYYHEEHANNEFAFKVLLNTDDDTEKAKIIANIIKVAQDNKNGSLKFNFDTGKINGIYLGEELVVRVATPKLTGKDNYIERYSNHRDVVIDHVVQYSAGKEKMAVAIFGKFLN